MKVILLKDVKGLGKKGDKVTVSDGYGANFIIPKGLGVLETIHSNNVLNREKAAEAERQEKLRVEAEEIKEKLKNITLEFTLPGQNGKVFGSISTKQVEEELKIKYQIVVDKRKIIDKTSINCFGITIVKIELYKNVIGEIKVHVSERN